MCCRMKYGSRHVRKTVVSQEETNLNSHNEEKLKLNHSFPPSICCCSSSCFSTEPESPQSFSFCSINNNSWVRFLIMQINRISIIQYHCVIRFISCLFSFCRFLWLSGSTDAAMGQLLRFWKNLYSPSSSFFFPHHTVLEVDSSTVRERCLLLFIHTPWQAFFSWFLARQGGHSQCYSCTLPFFCWWGVVVMQPPLAQSLICVPQ